MNLIDFDSYGLERPMYYHIYPSRLGKVLLATSEQGVCALFFIQEAKEVYLEELFKRFGVWPHYAPDKTAIWWQKLKDGYNKLPLIVRGSAFQQKVWTKLCTIPSGTSTTYQALAERLGVSGGARAVGNALAQNHIAYLIPCHRVFRKNGELGGYRWGLEVKRALWETEKLGHSFWSQEE